MSGPFQGATVDSPPQPQPRQDDTTGRCTRPRRRPRRLQPTRRRIPAPCLQRRLSHAPGTRMRASDAVQDSFIKAYRALNTFRGGSFKSWLMRIVVNTCYDELRSRKRQFYRQHRRRSKPNRTTRRTRRRLRKPPCLRRTHGTEPPYRKRHRAPCRRTNASYSLCATSMATPTRKSSRSPASPWAPSNRVSAAHAIACAIICSKVRNYCRLPCVLDMNRYCRLSVNRRLP